MSKHPFIAFCLGCNESQVLSATFGMKDALGGTLRQVLAATRSVDFLNTNFVDLGTLTWTYSAAAKKFYATYNGMQNVDSSTVGNILCTKYKAATAANLNDNEYDMHCAIVSGNEIQVKDLTYTDATAFQAAMKGVLLAYVKA